MWNIKVISEERFYQLKHCERVLNTYKQYNEVLVKKLEMADKQILELKNENLELRNKELDKLHQESFNFGTNIWN